MPQVKVRRRGISAEDAAGVLRSSLAGEKVEITQNGDRELEVTRSFLARASVSISDEPGGTMFNVRGGGRFVPGIFVLRVISSRGIARRVADALEANEGFRDDA
jgi:hypothetical protein